MNTETRTTLPKVLSPRTIYEINGTFLPEDYFEVMAKEQGISMTLIIPEKHIFVKGNKRLLEELLTNLVSNAMQNMRENVQGEIRVELRIENNNTCMLVEDNGTGIPKEDIPRLFERFYCSKRRPGQGTGLGLAISARIAERHGGAISVESTFGKTIFAISLPLKA